MYYKDIYLLFKLWVIALDFQKTQDDSWLKLGYIYGIYGDDVDIIIQKYFYLKRAIRFATSNYQLLTKLVEDELADELEDLKHLFFFNCPINIDKAIDYFN